VLADAAECVGHLATEQFQCERSQVGKYLSRAFDICGTVAFVQNRPSFSLLSLKIGLVKRWLALL